MNKPKAAAAPTSGDPDVPTFEDLAADPEIALLLDFEPVPRKLVKANGWTPAMQRMFIAWLAWYGSPTRACDELGMARSGVDKLYKAADAEEFCTSWDEAVALYECRRIAQTASRHGGSGALRAPTPSRERARGRDAIQPLLPGQVYNERGQPEDEASLNRRGEEARDSIGDKLLRCRRAYLLEISRNPGKRAAFELLTELPIDWDKARRHQPQDHEPWRRPNFREGDMVLTAENGWLGSIVPTYGPDKMTELREGVNRARVKRGLPPIVDWSEDAPRDDEAASDAPPDRPVRHCVEIEDEAPAPEPDTGFRPNTVPQPDAPNTRNFDLNSKEFYDRVKQSHPGILPRQPTEWAPEPVLKIGPAPRVGPVKGRRK